jgi:hypothetical protein
MPNFDVLKDGFPRQNIPAPITNRPEDITKEVQEVQDPEVIKQEGEQ